MNEKSRDEEEGHIPVGAIDHSVVAVAVVVVLPPVPIGNHFQYRTRLDVEWKLEENYFHSRPIHRVMDVRIDTE